MRKHRKKLQYQFPRIELIEHVLIGNLFTSLSYIIYECQEEMLYNSKKAQLTKEE
jgi:hypothetical protein